MIEPLQGNLYLRFQGFETVSDFVVARWDIITGGGFFIKNMYIQTNFVDVKGSFDFFVATRTYCVESYNQRII